MTVDDREWSDRLNFLIELYRRKGYLASVAGAEAIKEVASDKLTARRHAPQTKTPSGNGDPPAAISGRLAASLEVRGDAATLSAEVGPTSTASSYNGPYGRIQELGGPSSGNPMVWVEDGVPHKVRFRRLPERPYLKPATKEIIGSGKLRRIYVDKWAEAQREATTG
jgi:hypothetical protein